MRLRPLAFGLLLATACAEPPGPEAPAQARAALVSDPASAQLHSADQSLRLWLTSWSAASAPQRAGLLEQGVVLANARRTLMRQLLLEAPEKALPLAFSTPERNALPGQVREKVERWHDGLGTLHVVALMLHAPSTGPAVERFVTFNDAADTFLRAGVFGRRFDQSTRANLKLHGAQLDDVIGLTESPLRRLAKHESIDLPVEYPSLCPTSGRRVVEALVFHAGDSAVGFCVTPHAEAFEQMLIDQEGRDEPAHTGWTLGPKKILMIRVDFSDRVGDPISATDAVNLISSQVNGFFDAASYGQTSLTGTATATLRMPRTAAYYSSANDYNGLRSDAIAAATTAGIAYLDFDFEVICSVPVFGGFAGAAYVNSRGTWLNGYYDLRVAGHELGHNYGVYHANFWSAGDSIIGPGSNVEYGNPFDIMGGASNGHFNVWFKRVFNWVPTGEVQVVSTSGSHRIFALESPIASGLHGLKVPRLGDPKRRDYWVEYRAPMNGALVNFGLQYMSPTGSQLLQMAGGGSAGDSALIIGRTYADPLAGIFLTPVAKGGTVPESLDVVVNVGTFAGNRSPTATLSASASSVANGASVTFTLTASDPDADVLAYAWDFEDGSSAPNTAVVTRALSGDRVFNVRCTVSDMKGGLVTVATLVTAGAPTGFTLSGTVLRGGTGLGEVTISDGTRTTLSSSDGTWRLTNVPAGSTTLSAAKFDHLFVAGFTTPITVSGSATGLDFTATQAVYSVSGSVTGSTTVEGVIISDGSRSASTNAAGAYSLSGVPTSRLTMTAAKPGWSFQPGVNPIEVFASNLTVDFYASGQYVAASIPAEGVPTAPIISDGIRSATCRSGGGSNGGLGDGDPKSDGGISDAGMSWSCGLYPLPNGAWNLTATSPGVTLTPNNFTNPVMIAGTSVLDLTFRVAPGTTFFISGDVKTGGVALPGVTVSDGTRSSITDEVGHYVIVGVPAGSFTVTPSRPSLTFVPASRAVTVGPSSTGQDFATTSVNLAPTLTMAPAATPNPVLSGTTASLSVLGADDSGEAALFYTWVEQSGQPSVTFSANGTNTAKSTTATFTRSGTFELELTATDPGGLSVRGTVSVQVNQVATTLSVTPAVVNVQVGATQMFLSQLSDQFARAMYAPAATWSVEAPAGSISAAGFFTGALTPGGPFSVTAQQAGKTATATVRVVPAGTPTIAQAAAATPSPVTGTTAQLSVLGADNGGEPALTSTWAAVGAPTPVTFSANGTNAAKSTTATFSRSGDYDFVVTLADTDALTVTSAVHVVVQPTPTSIALNPLVAMVVAGGSMQYTATVIDQFGSPLAPQPAVTFTVSGGGAIDAAGRFVAGPTMGGPFVIEAKLGLVTKSASITISDAPDTLAPTVALTSPTAGARLTGSAPLTSTSSDNVGVTKVEYLLDGVKIAESVSPPFDASFDFATATGGTHVLVARASDAAGNTTSSDGVTIEVDLAIVDMTAPVVSILEPRSGMTSTLVDVSVEATDDVRVTRVDLELGGTVVRQLTQPPWVAQLTVSVGPHTLVAIAHDLSGKSTRSAPVSFSARTDGVNPDAGTQPLDGGATEPVPGTPDPVVGKCGGCQDTGSTAPMLLLGALVLGLLRKRRTHTPSP